MCFPFYFVQLQSILAVFTYILLKKTIIQSCSINFQSYRLIIHWTEGFFWWFIITSKYLSHYFEVVSARERGFDAGMQTPVSHRQNHWWQGDEDGVGKASNDQEEISRGAAVVVEVVDRNDAGSPRYNEEHNQTKNHLMKKEKNLDEIIKTGYWCV